MEMIIGLIGVLVSIIAMVISVITYVKTYLYEKRRLTIDKYIELQDFLYCISEYSLEELEDFVDDKTSEEYRILVSCLARIELFAIGVKKKIYDYKVFYEIGHGYLDGAIRPQILYLLSTKKNADTYYANTIWILNKMEQD